MTPETIRAHIVHLLTTHRLPLSDEKALQAAIATMLADACLAHQREVRLAPGDIVDFMVAAGIAIEVKIKGSRRAIFKQIARYAQHAEVREIVLATNVPMGLPEEINGKPVAIAALGRGWL